MHGIEISNTGGKAQVAEGYESMVLVKEGVASTVSADFSNNPPYSGVSVQIPSGLSHKDVLLFVGSLPSARGVLLIEASSAGFALYGYQTPNNVPSVFNFPYRIYARSSKAMHLAPTDEKYGIQVSDSAGRVVFDSRMKQLKINGVVDHRTETNGNITITGPRTSLPSPPWVLVNGSASPFALHFRRGVPSVFYGVVVCPSANGIEFSAGIIGTFPPSEQSYVDTFDTKRSFTYTY